LGNFLNFMIEESFFLVIALLYVLFKHRFKLFDELTMYFKVYKTMAEISLTISNLKEILGFHKLLMLYIYYLLDKFISLRY